MAHEVEQMVSVREVPWHGLGTIVDETMTAKEALVLGGLDWEVELAPLTATPSHHVQLEMVDGEPQARRKPYEGEPIAVENQFAVVRDSDLSVLGIVGSQYAPIQNWKAFEFFDALVDSGEAKYETAGSLRGGRQIFLTAFVPREIMVGGVDPVNLYLALLTSHDGSRAFTAAVTPVRVVCMNTANWAMSQAKQTWSVKHTESADGRLSEARATLGLTFKYADEFQEQADRLISEEYTKAQFEKMVKDLVASKDVTDDSARQTQMALIGTFESSPTIDDAFRYTKWGAVNAVAEFYDWIRPMRGSKTKSEAESRTEASWFGVNKKQKEKALALISA